MAQAVTVVRCFFSSDWRFWQSLRFADRTFKVTFAALDGFVGARSTTNPVYVFSFAIFAVVASTCLMGGLALLLYSRVRNSVQSAVLQEQHKKLMLQASKAAHEKTIAYACHQLRYGMGVRCGRSGVVFADRCRDSSGRGGGLLAGGCFAQCLR